LEKSGQAPAGREAIHWRGREPFAVRGQLETVRPNAVAPALKQTDRDRAARPYSAARADRCPLPIAELLLLGRGATVYGHNRMLDFAPTKTSRVRCKPRTIRGDVDALDRQQKTPCHYSVTALMKCRASKLIHRDSKIGIRDPNADHIGLVWWLGSRRRIRRARRRIPLERAGRPLKRRIRNMVRALLRARRPPAPTFTHQLDQAAWA
jgi:hypothetical protein